MSQWRSRWFALAFGTLHAVAVGVGLWGLPVGALTQTADASPVAAAQPFAQSRLWAYLGSEAYIEDQLVGKLAAAEQERLHAQQLRLDAEAQAENIVASAAQRARNRTKAAIEQSESIQLDTTFIGAEQIIYGEVGDAVTLKFAARIQCREGSFGETAVATPLDWRIEPREVRNLGACFVSERAIAGEPIGEVGAWGVGFFKRE